MALPERNSNSVCLLPRLRNWRLGLAVFGALLGLAGCATTIPEKRKDVGVPVSLPFMRMEANECYFLDEFMPTPDTMVTGRATGLFLRYYTYDEAIYKIWNRERVMLSFYSRDNRCWSLFEEYQEVR